MKIPRSPFFKGGQFSSPLYYQRGVRGDLKVFSDETAMTCGHKRE